MTTTEPMSEESVTPWWELSGMERELAKYDQCEEPGDCDHDHDNAIEYFREQELNELRQRAEKAEARAEEQAKAHDHWLSYAGDLEAKLAAERTRAETAEREVANQREANRNLAKYIMRTVERAATAEREVAEVRGRLGGYTIGSDGDDAATWPYVACNRCRHDVWTGEHIRGALNLADAVDQAVVHDCDKAAELRNIVAGGARP